MSTDESKHPYVTQWDWFRKEQQEHEYEIGFFGLCLGVTLSWSGELDPHVRFGIVVEDDGLWSVLHSACGLGTHWLPELQAMLAQARDWMDANCVKEKYGYIFKGERMREKQS